MNPNVYEWMNEKSPQSPRDKKRRRRKRWRDLWDSVWSSHSILCDDYEDDDDDDDDAETEDDEGLKEPQLKLNDDDVVSVESFTLYSDKLHVHLCMIIPISNPNTKPKPGTIPTQTPPGQNLRKINSINKILIPSATKIST